MTIELKELAGGLGIVAAALFIGALCHVALMGGV
jgi:hypothetical protein